MQSLFNEDAYREIRRRAETLGPGAERQWGKMTVAQMMEHASRALEMAAGKTPSRQAALGKLIGWIFRKQFVGPAPFGKNAPTGPAFIVQGEPEFERTKARLVQLIDEFHALGERGCDGNVHGFFGPLSGAEWGVTQFKHLDHHLRQFGA